MARGMLIVESRPASPEDADAFHKWYEEVHMREMLAVDGIVSARRFASVDGDSFVAIYEFDVDVDTAKANLGAAQKSGKMSPPQGLQLNPPPTMRYLRQLKDFARENY
jgi:hypothetical protein